MRTIYPMIVVLAIAVASIMFAMSGVGALFGEDPTTSSAGDDLEDRKNESAVQDAEDGDDGLGLDGSSSSDLIGFIINGGQAIVSSAVLVVKLPLALRNIGFPVWFAFPLGLVSQVIVSIGIMQFISGRTLE